MRCGKMLVRTAIVLVGGLVAVVVYSAELRRDAAADATEAVWDQVRVGVEHYTVKQMFGRPGRAVLVPGWAKRLREVPGYETGLPFTFLGSDGSVIRHVVPPDTEVRWRVWRVAGPR